MKGPRNTFTEGSWRFRNGFAVDTPRLHQGCCGATIARYEGIADGASADHPPMDVPRRRHGGVSEVFTEAPRRARELRRLRGGFMKPSWSLRGCSRRHHGRFTEPWRLWQIVKS